MRLESICERRHYNESMIYYVEDDTNIRELALYALRQAGFDAQGFADAVEFDSACAHELPDLILLDIMLPQTDGITMLKKIRADKRMADIPVMMLTAKGTEYDKVVGLDTGADDYLAKPFGMMELVSRCNALLRRQTRKTPATDEDCICCGNITLSPSAHEAQVAETPLELTLKEFELLKKLMEEHGHALSRAALLEDIWGITFIGESRTVDTHIQTLRRKLNDAQSGTGDLIQTVRGIGYRLKAD